jgi:hypothetical protein
VKASSEDAIVSSRTYNLTTDGKTFGQGIPGIRLDTVVAAPSLVLKFRTITYLQNEKGIYAYLGRIAFRKIKRN